MTTEHTPGPADFTQMDEMPRPIPSREEKILAASQVMLEALKQIESQLSAMIALSVTRESPKVKQEAVTWLSIARAAIAKAQ